jgi:hypothetical protein
MIKQEKVHEIWLLAAYLVGFIAGLLTYKMWTNL